MATVFTKGSNVLAYTQAATELACELGYADEAEFYNAQNTNPADVRARLEALAP